MTLSSESRRLMTTHPLKDDRQAGINPKILQTLNDEWGRLVLHHGHRLELLADTAPSEDVTARVNREIIPPAERAWQEYLSVYLDELWGADQSHPARARYSQDRFITAISLYANRPQRSAHASPPTVHAQT